MKSHVKPINSFLAENENPEDLELRSMGFDPRHELSDEYEIEEVLHKLFLSNDRVMAAYKQFIKELDRSCAKLKAGYRWDKDEMESMLTIYTVYGSEQESDSLIYFAVSDKIKELNDELS